MYILEVVWCKECANATFNRSLWSFNSAKCQKMVKKWLFLTILTINLFTVGWFMVVYSWDGAWTYSMRSLLQLGSKLKCPGLTLTSRFVRDRSFLVFTKGLEVICIIIIIDTHNYILLRGSLWPPLLCIHKCHKVLAYFS